MFNSPQPINSYQKDFNTALAKGLGYAALLSLIVHIIMISVTPLIFKKEETKRYKVSIFSSIYSNCGFMAIPLMSAVLGNTGVFYGSAYFAVFTVLAWTHGIIVYSGNAKDISLKKVFINPGVIGVTIAVSLFFLRIKLPYILDECVKYMAGLNTPLAMIVLGTYLVGIDFKKSFKNTELLKVLGLRLVIFPIITIFLARLLHIPEDITRCVVIPSACSTAAIATLFATKYNLDAKYASEIVSISTILSIITIPLIMFI